MKTILRSVLLGLCFVALGCKVDDLPREKSLKNCQKPAATITATVDPTDFRKYTFALTGVTGEVTQVAWTANGQTQTVAAGQSLAVTFPQAGSYSVSASLQNVCNNNTVVQTNVTVAAGTPVVNTGQPTGVGTTSATVEMTVTSLGGNPSLSEYGIVYAEAPNNSPTVGNDLVKPATTPVALNTPVQVTLTGLKPGTTYYYRGYVKTSSGTTHSNSIGQFTTTRPAVNTWARTYGGLNADIGYFILPLNDGGAVFVGNSDSNNSGDFQYSKRGAYDAWMARVDANGALLWIKNYGGLGDDNLRGIQDSGDGNFIVIGHTNSTESTLGTNWGDYDIWVMKITPTGDVLWSRKFGGSGADFGFSVQPTADRGYVCAGRTSSSNGQVSGQHGGADAWVFKINSEGTMQWQRCLGGSGDETALSLAATGDGGGVMAGQVGSSDGDLSGVPRLAGKDMWVVKLTPSGSSATIDWQRADLGGGGEDIATSVQVVSNEAIVAFQVSTTSNSTDGKVAKLSMGTGSPTGTSILLGNSQRDEINYLQPTSDGGYILAGTTESTNVPGYKGASDAWVIKLNASLNVEWQKAFGGSGIDQGNCIRPLDQGYILVGFASSTNNGDVPNGKGNYDVFVVKMNATGGY
jgi:hypothetical protein